MKFELDLAIVTDDRDDDDNDGDDVDGYGDDDDDDPDGDDDDDFVAAIATYVLERTQFDARTIFKLIKVTKCLIILNANHLYLTLGSGLVMVSFF